MSDLSLPVLDPLEHVEILGWSLGERDVPAAGEGAFAGFAPPPDAGIAPRGTGVCGGLHVVRRGCCVLDAGAHGSHTLAAGDLVILPGGVPHALRCAPGERIATRVLAVGFHFGGAGAARLCDALPAVVRVSGREAAGVAPLLDHLARARGTGGPGARASVNHAVQLLVVELLRGGWAGHPEWLECWRAPRPSAAIVRARDRIERAPAGAWSLATLAREACMSRSVFAARFAAEVGVAPGRFVLECRMREAARLLGEGECSVKAVACEVGYRSRSAFSHAFRRWAGRAPASARAHRAEPDSGVPGNGSVQLTRPGRRRS